MADENINEADLISTLVELGLLKEYKQLAEILFENKELLKIKDKENNSLNKILRELNIDEIHHILNVIQDEIHNEKHDYNEEEENMDKSNDSEIRKEINDRDSIGISIFPKENENDNIEVNNIHVNIVERPRFAVSHMLKKRTILEESKDDDYNMFTFVDEGGLKHFKNIFASFLKINMKEKGDKIYTCLVNNEQENIKKDIINIQRIQTSITPFIKESSGIRKNNKGCCFKIFNSKKSSKLENIYDFFQQLNSLSEEIEGLNILDDKALTISKKDKFILTLNDIVEARVNNFIQETNYSNKLKDEVDKYAEYFNANKIVEKQRKKLESQKIKINLCEDSKNLKDCIICMDQERSTLFYPCLHLIVCQGCAEVNVKSECPECHKAIERKEELSL